MIAESPRPPGPTEYEELRLRLWRTGRDRYLVFANGPASGAVAVTLPRSAREYWSALDELLQEDFGRRSGASDETTRRRLRSLGRELYGRLFPEPIARALEEGLERAQSEGRNLRLRFEVAPELSDLPLESLCAGPESPLRELVLQPPLSVVRSLTGQPVNLRLPRTAEDHQALHMVVIVASPDGGGYPAVNAGREIAAIENSLNPVLGAMNPLPVTVLGRVSGRPRARRATRRNIEQLLGRVTSPCLLVLIAHGLWDEEQGEGLVVLEGPRGQPDPVPGNILQGLLAGAPGLRAVVLNLCLGARTSPGEPFSGLAQALVAGGIPAVVAMQSEISDGAACDFSPELCHALCRNQTLDQAVAAGRRAMADRRETRIEWCNPAIFLHERCGHGWLYKVQDIGDAPPDPLRRAEEALQAIDRGQALSEPEVRCAIELLQKERNWSRIPRVAQRGQALAPHDPRYERLQQEAETELVTASVKKLCAVLAREADPGPEADDLLEQIEAALPAEVFAAVEAEVAEARELSHLYRLGCEAERQRHWGQAADCYEMVLDRRREGYRDALLRAMTARRYAEAEQALEECDWNEVRRLYLEVLRRHRHQEDLRAEFTCETSHRLAASGAALARGHVALRANRFRRAVHAFSRVDEELFEEAPSWTAYAEARMAEADQRWTDAVRAYGRVDLEVTGGVKLEERRGYAAARSAEEQGAWNEALELFGALGQHFLDVRERLLYARGRWADEAGDWAGVIEGFGSLPDGYRGGDVGLRRRHARGRRADAEEDWSGVVEALRGVPGDYRDGEAGRLVLYARARRAEADGDWGEAAALYAELGDRHRDAPVRGAYADGRHAEDEADWSGAAAAYSRLLDGEPAAELRRDAAERHAYAAGRQAESERRWAAAAEAYGRILDGDLPPEKLGDTAERRAVAVVRAADAEDDWTAVLAAAAELGAASTAREHAAGRGECPDPFVAGLPCRAGEPAAGELSRLREYAAGRLAEASEDWGAALEHHRAARGHRDADARVNRIAGRLAEALGLWSRALDQYRSLAGGDQDLAARIARLEALLEAAPWLDGLAAAGLVADPAAHHFEILAYEALRPAGVTPSSPAREIRDASYALMERGSMTPPARLAWDRLRTLPGRLAVDARLHRLGDPRGLQLLQQSLLPGTPEEVLETLCAELPADAPLMRLLAGRRVEAIERWQELLAARPLAADVVHHLALARLWQARELEESGAYEQAEAAWEHAIAGWARLLDDDAYWERWRQERTARYRETVGPTHLALLRDRLSRRLLDELLNCAEDADADDRQERAAAYRRLALALEVELEAVRALRDAGGLATADGAPDGLVAGGLYLRHAGLGTRLGRKVAAATAEIAALAAEGEATEAATAVDLLVGEESEEVEGSGASRRLLRLRVTFSALGPAFVLLDNHQPERALRELPDLLQRHHTELDADCEPAAALDPGHAASCERCRDYRDRNPGYLGLAHRESWMLQDAVGIAARAHLDLARSALAGARRDLRSAIDLFRGAIEVGRRAGAEVRIKAAVTRFVLGRADAWAEIRDRERGRRLGEAIELIESARHLLGGADRERLDAGLAKILSQRGVWHGNGGPDDGEPDYERAAADLRRALALVPGSLHARDNLSRALVFHAANVPRSAGPRKPFELFAEAIAVLHEGLSRTAGNHQLQLVLKETLNHLEEWVLLDLSEDDLVRRIQDPAAPRVDREGSPDRLAAAREQRQAGDATGALLTLIQAVREDRDPALRQALLDLVVDRARALAGTAQEEAP